ncbi:Cytochrome c oxidase protein 20 -like protein [Collichthys lucidus]|uniref:Cytochrome c oxidase assembly protein COX20, mitochondrial n=1 Tax=Collichthys lucidus TaxID=240159 RepID=A0A4U5VCN3_COLLU|nr:Cytochrome c oxidase protein 20 -like protein [Collichthys lucidus]
MAGQEEESKNKVSGSEKFVSHGGRVRRSFHVGFAGFMLTTLGSWFYCRLNNAKLRVQQRMIQDGIKNKIVYEGTAIDPTRKHGAQTPPGPS